MLGRLEYKVVAGIGLLSITRENAKAGVNDLVNRGKIAPEDAEATIEELVRHGEEEQAAIREIARHEIVRVLKDG